MDNQALQSVGRIFGVSQRNKMLLENEEERNFIMDFLLNEYQQQGQTFIQRYLHEHPELAGPEAEVLEGYLNSYISLFKIVATNPKNSTLTFANLLQDQPEIEIVNINLSRTAIPGLLIFSRVTPMKDFNTLSGMFAIFNSIPERTILKQTKVLMKKVKSERESTRLFVAMFKLNRQQGLSVHEKDV
jgi:hypothetical protein